VASGDLIWHKTGLVVGASVVSLALPAARRRVPGQEILRVSLRHLEEPMRVEEKLPHVG